MIRIISLSNETLNNAISIIADIFPYKADQDNARYNLTDSLIKSQPRKHYWVAVNEQEKVVGIVGLYDDRRNSTIVWLGWFGVDLKYRKHGIGSALLQFAINEAKERGFSTLKLYTSADKNEMAAHSLYRKFGFTKLYKDTKTDRMFFMKTL